MIYTEKNSSYKNLRKTSFSTINSKFATQKILVFSSYFSSQHDYQTITIIDCSLSANNLCS